MDEFNELFETHEGNRNAKPRPMPRVDTKQVMQALMVDASKEPCFLCQGEPWCLEIYQVPEGLNRMGQKMIFYTLCQADTMDITGKGRAEYQLIKQLQAENGLVAA